MNIFYPLAGALFLANVVKAALAAVSSVNAKVRLYTDALTPDSSVTEAQLVAAEATYDGYAALGSPTWIGAYYDPNGGATIQSGTQYFAYVDSSTHVHNNINGAWIEDHAGNLLAVIAFDHPVTMAANGDAIPLDIALNFGNNG